MSFFAGDYSYWLKLLISLNIFWILRRDTKRGKTKLRNNAETVKHILSKLDTANCYIESLYDGIDFSTNITRARFENELSKIMSSLLDPIHDILSSSGIKASDIDKVKYKK